MRRSGALRPRLQRTNVLENFCLAPSLNLGCYQAHLIYSRSMGDVNHISYVSKRNVIVAFHEHHLFCPGLEDVGEPALQVFPGGVLSVDLNARRLSRTAIN